jgi:hypothetical protein
MRLRELLAGNTMPGIGLSPDKMPLGRAGLCRPRKFMNPMDSMVHRWMYSEVGAREHEGVHGPT